MADGDVAAQRGEHGLVEHLGDQAHVLVHHDPGAVADRDAGRLLPPVLQRVQAEVGELGDFLARRPDAEYTTRVLRRPVPVIDVIGQPAIGLDHGASLRGAHREQRQPGRQVGPRPAGADLPRGHRLRPAALPAASAIQVTGSVSTTFGGVPRVCRGPSMHCTAA